MPAMLLSSSNDKDIAGKGFSAGFSEYLMKPFVEEEFLARVQKLLKA